MESEYRYEPGDVVNRHAWTGTQWVPITHGQPNASGNYEAREGLVVDRHVWIDGDWVPVQFRKPIDPVFLSHGKPLVEGGVGGYGVRIFETGFVQVITRDGFSRKWSEPERLVSITASDMSSQKTGFGRAVGATATAGLSLFGPSKRGSVYLTIVTDQTTHVLTSSPPTEWDIEAMLKIEGAGRALLQRQAEQSEQSQHGSLPKPTQEDLVQQLERLAQMHASGSLTDSEFAAAKAQLLGNI